MWDEGAVSIPAGRMSMKMGRKLEDIIDIHDLFVHNSGVATYNSGPVSSAPDVTLSMGITQYGNVKWSVTDESLQVANPTRCYHIGCCK